MNLHSAFTHCLILFSAVFSTGHNLTIHPSVRLNAYMGLNWTPLCASNVFSLEDINGRFGKPGQPPAPASGLSSNPPITPPVLLHKSDGNWTALD